MPLIRFFSKPPGFRHLYSKTFYRAHSGNYKKKKMPDRTIREKKVRVCAILSIVFAFFMQTASTSRSEIYALELKSICQGTLSQNDCFSLFRASVLEFITTSQAIIGASHITQLYRLMKNYKEKHSNSQNSLIN